MDTNRWCGKGGIELPQPTYIGCDFRFLDRQVNLG